MERANVNPIFRDKRRRAWELDFLRGIAVIAMCFDHLMFDLASFKSWFSNSREIHNEFMLSLNKFAIEYWKTTSDGFRFWAHYLFVFLFLFLVGTSCAFSRDNTRRGAVLGVVSIVFTGATFVLREFGIMEYGVVFGVLHCIALCILCAAAVDNLTSWNKYVNLFAPLVIGVIIIAVGIGVGFWNILFEMFDEVFTNEHFTGYVLGTHAYGDDWFGLFPYLGVVLVGFYWGRAAYKTRSSLIPALDRGWHKPFTFVGKHALIFYLAHQIVLAGIVVAVCLAVGYKF